MKHNHIDEYNHTQLQRDLLLLLDRHQKKPYLPIWGELFCNLRQFKRMADREKSDLELYPLQPTGSLSYEHQTGKFVAHAPEIHLRIALSLEECVDALVNGRFLPAHSAVPAASRTPLADVMPSERSAYDMAEN